MKRYILAGLSILAVAAGVGWKVARHPETSASLHEIKLDQASEHTNAGPTQELAGIRFRLGPNGFGYEMRATSQKVPHISVAAE
jgi:hypothetical protein